MTGPRGLLLVGHGTRSAAGAGQFAALVAAVRARVPDRPVTGGFIELAAPPLADAVAELAAAGCRQVDVVPLMLVAAGHVKGDIPASLARERERHPQLHFHYGRPLGPHADLLDQLEERLDEVVDRADRAGTTVLLVGRGATDPDANAEVAKVARLLAEGRGLAGVEIAFISLADPAVPAGLDRCAQLGARRVVVSPYFLFEGVLPDRVGAQARAWAAAHPQVQVHLAGVLGPSDALAGLVAERAAEAAAGTVRMGCDTCLYRVALPGFTARVGAPQTPHEHPAESAAGHHHHLDPALRHHGDSEALPGLIDAAVNVRLPGPPPWLEAALAATLPELGRYPRPAAAVAAVAARHHRDPAEVLLTAGAAEAFVLLARALPATRAVVIHPQFTEPEAALRAAGRPVTRVLLGPPYRLDPALVPPDADLVMVGNPTNPTSVLHPAATLAALARPGRTLVVDEAFLDAVPGEPESLAARRDLPGLVVVRSLTKTWGLAGLRVGYLLAAPSLLARLAAVQPLWPVSSPALAALTACASPAALAEAAAAAVRLAAEREFLAAALAALPGVEVTPGGAGPFLLVRAPAGTREALRAAGVAVRRGDTFPGLDAGHLRVAVRESRERNSAVIERWRALPPTEPAGGRL